jgi:dihydroflavonol-4-reductase
VRILITGGTGFVGTAVARAAVAAGHEVRVLAREPGLAHDLARLPLELRAGSPLEGAAMAAALAGVDVLVQAAATYSYRRADATRMITENPAITRAALDAARRAGTPHVIDVSSVIVLKPHPGRAGRPGVTDVTSPSWSPADEQWGDPYLRSKVLAHEVATTARAGGMPVSIVFPSMVIGPGDRTPGTSGALVRAMLRERVSIDASVGWCDVRDVADVTLAVAGGPPGRDALVSVGTVTLEPMSELIDAVTGRRRRRLFVPAGIVHGVARLNDRLGAPLRALPPAATLAYLMTRGPVDGQSGERILGRDYRPLEETLADTLRWWAENGLITAAEAGLAA